MQRWVLLDAVLRLATRHFLSAFDPAASTYQSLLVCNDCTPLAGGDSSAKPLASTAVPSQKIVDALPPANGLVRLCTAPHIVDPVGVVLPSERLRDWSVVDCSTAAPSDEGKGEAAASASSSTRTSTVSVRYVQAFASW